MALSVVRISVVAAALLGAGQAIAASMGAPQPYCHLAEDAYTLVNYESASVLREEVRSRYEHAADIARSDRAIYSQSPLFLWANEAKVSCAKAYGYLRRPRKWRKRPDVVMLQKCECFYQRMTRYLGY